MISIGIVGASGYTGEELIRLLLKHPEASIDVLTSRTYAGKCVDDIYSFDKKLDSKYPSSLSRIIINDMLRNDLGFKGPVICDDPSMRAISDHYSLHDTFELMINAGVDLFCLGNNLIYDPEYIPKSIRVIEDLINSNKVTEKRILKSIKSILENIKSRRPKFEYEVKELNRVIPSMTDKDAPIVKSIAASVEKVIGKKAEYVASPGSYDQKHIDRIGTLKNCIAYGPGILDLAHKPDEFVDVEDMIDSAKVMGNSLIDILT